MKKWIAPLALAGSLFTLYACMTSSDGSGTTNIAWEWDEPVTSLNQTSTPKLIVTQYTDYDCVNGAAVAYTEKDSSNYYVNGGKLYLWDKGACGAEAYTGTSTTIIGTWTDSVLATVAIPSAAPRPAGCTGTVSEEDGGGLGSVGDILKNGKATATVSTTNVHLKFSGELCFAPLFAAAFAEDTADIKVTSSDCQSVQLKVVQTSQTASITTSFSNNTMAISFKSGGKTCTLSEPFGAPGTVPSCSASNSTSADSTFDACLYSTDFGGGMAKRSSAVGGLEMSIPQALHKSIRHSHF